MDNLTAQLLPASFKGFEFLTNEERVTKGGRKIVEHDYPNSGRRFPQDMGPLPEAYEMPGIISGPNFIQRANEFRQILSEAGSGKLVLPHQGTVTVTALPHRINYAHTNIGRIEFSLSFTTSNADQSPAEGRKDLSDVYQLGDESRQQCQDIIIEEYVVPEEKLDVLTMIQDTRKSVVDTVRETSSQIITANAQLQKVVNDIQNDLITIVKSPQDLAQRLIYGTEALVDGFFSTLSRLYSETVTNAQQLFDISTSYGSDIANNGASVFGGLSIPLWPEDTQSRILRNNNRILSVESTRINTFLIGMEVASNFNYQDTQQIDNIISSIESTYDALFVNVPESSIFGNNNDFVQLVDEMKAAVFDVLDQKEQAIFSIGEFYVHGEYSVMNLAYRLYAESFENSEQVEERAEALVDLNPQVPPPNIKKEIKIFELN